MNCSQCGAPLRPAAQFCGKCGARLEPSMAAALPGAWGGLASGAGEGSWCVLRRMKIPGR